MIKAVALTFLAFALSCVVSCTVIPDQPYHKAKNSYSTKNFVYSANGWRVYQKDYDRAAAGDASPTKILGDLAPSYAVLEYRHEDKETGAKAGLWHPEQLQEVIKTLNIAEPSTYLYVFVHGWNNNAIDCLNAENRARTPAQCEKYNDLDNRNDYYDQHDLEVFQTMLFKRQLEMQRAGLVDVRVKGIFIGWRGTVTTSTIGGVALVKRVTDNAVNIGRNSSLAKDLETLSKTLSKDNHSRMVIAAHSFGAKVLTEAMMTNFKPKEDKTCYAPFGKQTFFLLINPAIEAAAFNNLYPDYALDCHFPQWVNITSKDDSVTRTVYPAGSLLFGISQYGWQNKGSWQTIGHNKAYHTHDFTLERYNYRLALYRSGEKEKFYSLYRPQEITTLIEEKKEDKNYKKFIELNQYPVTHLAYFANFFNAGEYTESGKKCSIFPVFFSSGPWNHDTLFLFSYRTGVKHKQAKIWNIYTDRVVIDAKGEWWEFNTHNAFSQTNTLRMFDAYVYQGIYPQPNMTPQAQEERRVAFFSLLNEALQKGAYLKQDKIFDEPARAKIQKEACEKD